MNKIITSRSNPKMLELRALLSKKTRGGMLLLEGKKMILEALGSGFAPVDVVYTSGFMQADPQFAGALLASGANMIQAADQVLESLCDTKTPQGIVASIPLPVYSPPRDGNIVALDCVQDPGNVGSIIRTADAFGYAGVLLSEDCADAFSPKAVRATMGSVFHLPVCHVDLESEIRLLRKAGYTIVASHLKGSDCPVGAGNKLLLIGNETQGVREPLCGMADVLYRIAMRGKAESLNAAAAAAVMLYKFQ